MKFWLSIVVFWFFAICNLLFAQNNNFNYDDLIELEKKGFHPNQNIEKSLVTNNYDLIYHRCNWQIDPAVKFIAGDITSYFKPNSNSFNQIQFDLASNMTIDSILYHSSLLSHTLTPTDLLTINFTGNLPNHQLDSLTIFYHGIPLDDNQQTFVQTTHENTPIIFTKSEPYGSKNWWPCKHNLNDKIDSIDIIVTTPSVNRVASNGILVEERIIGPNKLYHWKSNYPMAAYLVAISVTNYVYYSDYVNHPGASYEVLNYVYPETFDSASVHTPEIVDIMRLFDSLTIIYPFAAEKYGHAQFGWGGGMEHQTMSFMGDFNFSLMAHECAHQWFGDYITCGTWEDIWLNEGFATFFEGLAQQNLHPENWNNWKSLKIKNITTLPDGTTFCNDTTNIARIFSGRLTYFKGAYILHMLRWKLGDSIFFASLKSYLNDPQLKFSYAKTADLISHFETISGLDLTSFFEKWFYKQGYPSYQVVWKKTDKNLELTVNQSTSDPTVTFFDMPIPIKVIGETKDTLLVFDHQYSGQKFSAIIDFPIKDIQFDPELWILSNNNMVISSETDYSNLLNVVISPNPSSSEIQIQFDNPNITIDNFEIIDLNGKQIEKLTNIKTSTSTYTYPIKHLASGAYTLILQSNKQSIHFKFIKE